MEEGEKRGSGDGRSLYEADAKEPRLEWNSDTGCSTGIRNRKREIKLSKFLSQAQKLRLLERERHGTNHVQLPCRACHIAKFMQKHRKGKPGQIETSEGEGPFFGTNMKLVTKMSFGQPIIRSFSDMLSEYHRERHGIDLKVLEIKSNCCKGKSVSRDGAQCAKWFHVNFTANLKDDDGGNGDTRKVYFAELVVFRFRFTPLQCNVAASLPVDPDYFGNSFSCLLKHPYPELCHPSLEECYDQLISPSKSAPLETLALIRLQQLAGNRSWKGEPIWVFLSPTSSGGSVIQNRKKATPVPSQRVPISSKKTINMKDSRDIPVPKTFLMLEVEKEATRLVQRRELALAMAERIENYGKPRPKRNLLIESLLAVLPDCHKRKYGVELEGINDLRIQQSGYAELRREARWFHMNFNAKIKQDGDGGDTVELYFAEVVKITVLYPPSYPCKYIMTVCVAVGQSDPAGNSSECGMCSRHSDVQIIHPSKELHDIKWDFDPSKFRFWKRAEEFLKKKFPRG